MADTLQTKTPLRQAPYLVHVGLISITYFVVAKLSLLLAIPPGYATAVWPPSGIALAAALLVGNRIWPGVWIGAAIVNFTVNFSFVAALLIGCGNTLEALIGAALIRRHIGSLHYFKCGEDVVKFVAVAAVSSTVAATVALLPLSYIHPLSWAETFQNWWTWWLGDTVGIIIVMPLVLSWAVHDETTRPQQKKMERACFGILLLTASIVIVGGGVNSLAPLRLTFLILPFIIWAALRFSQREVTLAITAVCAVAIWNTVEGHRTISSASLNESLLLLLAFISTVVATGLTLCAVVGERGRAVDTLKQALRDLRDQATTDPLTGLANRRRLWEFLPRELMRATRSGTCVAAIMIDLDYFKQVNDSHGHEAGDLVLIKVATLFKGQIRGSDMAFRYGGEEFVLVLPDATPKGCQVKAEAIRMALKQLEIVYGGKPLGVTASLGVALFPDNCVDADSLLRASDEALYEAKHTGRDRVVISTTGKSQSI